MNNELIEKLAEKLGTTPEHLWGVLIRQAPISCSIHLAALVAYAALLAWSARRIYLWEPKDDDYDQKIVLEAFWVLVAIIGIMCLSTLPTALSGFVNPEYWALKQLLP